MCCNHLVDLGSEVSVCRMLDLWRQQDRGVRQWKDGERKAKGSGRTAKGSDFQPTSKSGTTTSSMKAASKTRNSSMSSLRRTAR